MCPEHAEKLSVWLEAGDGGRLARIDRFIRVEADLRQTREPDQGGGGRDQDECGRSRDPAGRDESSDPIAATTADGATGCDGVELDRGSRDGGHTSGRARVAGWLCSHSGFGGRPQSKGVGVEARPRWWPARGCPPATRRAPRW